MGMSEITINGSTFSLHKKGRAQAEQVVRLGNWLQRHGPQVMTAVSDQKVETTVDVLRVALAAMTVDALIDLYVVLVGCTVAFADEHFDVGDLVEVAVATYENQEGIQRLVNRFFYVGESVPASEGESSTKSEEPTDGQMI